MIAIVSFIGTYRATANYALEHGFGFASYGVPIVIDLFTVLLGYVIYAYSMAGIQKPAPLTVGLFTMAVLSTYFNIQHARQVNSTVSIAITLLGAIFPVILAFTIELISTMNHLRLKRSSLLQSDQQLVQAIAQKQKMLEKLDTKIVQAQETLSEIIVRQTVQPKRKKQSRSEDKNGSSTTREKVKDLQLAGRSASEIAELLKVSKSLVYTYMREEEAPVLNNQRA